METSQEGESIAGQDTPRLGNLPSRKPGMVAHTGSFQLHRRLKQEDPKLEPSLGYLESLSQNKKIKRGWSMAQW